MSRPNGRITNPKKTTQKVLDSLLADLLDQRGFSEVAKKLDPTRCEPEDSENEIADEVPPPPKPVPTALRVLL